MSGGDARNDLRVVADQAIRLELNAENREAASTQKISQIVQAQTVVFTRAFESHLPRCCEHRG